jgi:hypothetical protein
MTDDQHTFDSVWPVLERMDAADVQAACGDLSQGELTELARAAGVPRVVLARDSSAARVLRNRARRSARTARVVVEMLVLPTRDLVVAALGDERSEDPTYEDLLTVLPDIVERHGPRRVALLLAFAVDEKWAAADPCRRLLETDDRFVIDALGEPADDDTDHTPPRRSPAKPVDAEARPSPPKRSKQDRGKRKPPQAPPPRYKKKRPSDSTDHGNAPSDDTTTAAPPAVTLNGVAVRPDAHDRRPVRLVGSHRDLDRNDPLVGRMVLAEVAFDGPIPGQKVRPCVVIAASGRDELVVRPCYSEGGRRAGDFRAVPVSDVKQAGLDRVTFVSHDECRIPRSSVTAELGWLPVTDWNQL